MNLEPVILHDNNRSRQCGSIVDGRVYMSYRDKPKHYFKKYKGWAVSQDIIDYLVLKGIDDICIVDRYEHNAYKCTIKDFINHGHIIPASCKNDKQIVLPEKNMEVINLDKKQN